MWEKHILDWNRKGIDGAVVSYDKVFNLIKANSEREATDAYWQLDGLVCANGIAFDASLNVVQFILSSLPSCSKFAKKRCLELLGQISICESDASNPNVVNDNLKEMKNSSWYFFHGLQNDDVDHVWLYVDLIGVLAQQFDCLINNARLYLVESMNRNLSDSDKDLIKNTLIAIDSHT